MNYLCLAEGPARTALALALALVVDALIADPVSVWHPVRLIGKLAEAMEGFSRSLHGLPVPADASAGLGAGPPQGSPAEPRAVAAGTLAWALSICIPTGLALAVSGLSGRIHPAFGLVIDTLIIWVSIAPADLASHALRVKRGLERDRRERADAMEAATAIPAASKRQDPVHGRAAVAMLVGRDVSVLDEEAVARACVESVAESSIDGVAAPLFWAAFLGPWAALAYRCVNTMDSMFGHRNARYYSFGLVSARADDLANWLPARVSSFLACLAAPVAGGSIRGAFASFFRYRLSHASPNAGHPEAAYAGAFDLRLGGPVRYPEGLAEKPWMNPEGQPAGIMDIRRAVILMYLQTLVSALAFLACNYALDLLFQSSFSNL